MDCCDTAACPGEYFGREFNTDKWAEFATEVVDKALASDAPRENLITSLIRICSDGDAAVRKAREG